MMYALMAAGFVVIGIAARRISRKIPATDYNILSVLLYGFGFWLLGVSVAFA